MASHTVLVTGANRGIGRGLVAELLARPAYTVIATVRDPAAETSKSLSTLKTGEHSNLIVVKLDQQKDGDDAAKTLVKQLNSEHGITAIDTIIANAGIANHYGPAATHSIPEVREHFEVNAVAPLVLFQATWPLLQKSKSPVFAAVSTAVASIGAMEHIQFPALAYGGSKIWLNYAVRKIHFENEALTAFVVHPGWVQTDMGNAGAVAMGKDEAPVTLNESVQGILKEVDGATRETKGGKFRTFDGQDFTW